jgi:hypothetical protein
MDVNKLKKALARVSVLTVIGYVISAILFRIFPEFEYAELALGLLIGFNLVFITIQFRRSISPSSFFELDTSSQSKIIIQYVLNILIFIVFILRF